MKKKSFFSRNYLECRRFFYESRRSIVLALWIFVLFFVIGFAFPIFFREEIFGFVARMLAALEGKSAMELISFILLNNLKASFMAIVTGVGIGIFPLAIGIMNGYLLGFISREAVARGGFFVLWRLLPHGIFELPAIILSIGIGLKIGGDLLRRKGKLEYNLREGMRFFVFVVLPLLLVAAIVEGILIKFLK